MVFFLSLLSLNFEDQLSSNLHRVVFLCICWDTLSEKTGLWQYYQRCPSLIGLGTFLQALEIRITLLGAKRRPITNYFAFLPLVILIGKHWFATAFYIFSYLCNIFICVCFIDGGTEEGIPWFCVAYRSSNIPSVYSNTQKFVNINLTLSVCRCALWFIDN